MSSTGNGGTGHSGPGSGMWWLDQYMMRTARVQFEIQWFCFAFGQAGVMFEFARHDPERTEEVQAMTDQMEQSVVDFEAAAAETVAVMRDIVENARRNQTEAQT